MDQKVLDAVLKMTESDRAVAKHYFKIGNVCGTIGESLIRKLVKMDEDGQKRELNKFAGWRIGYIAPQITELEMRKAMITAQLEKLYAEKKTLEAI